MNTIINTEEASRFAAVFSDGCLAQDVGPALTCEEAEAIAGMLQAIGECASAAHLIRAHARADDVGDKHHQAAEEEYLVPIDPMDDLQCDSCQ